MIRHAVFRTFDDPIALNAHDYSTSNPQMGWIEDGVIEDCYDLDDEDTTGFFCRVLAGSWLPWREGMVVQRSDSVVYSGRVYRVVMPPDGARSFRARRPATKRDWRRTTAFSGAWRRRTRRSAAAAGTSCSGIFICRRSGRWRFRCTLIRTCGRAAIILNSEAPVQDNITFENVWVENDVPCF